MNNLYEKAIKELEKLLHQTPQKSPFSLEDFDRTSFQYLDDKDYMKGKRRNSFNQLPLNIIENLEDNISLSRSLVDFIDILKILKNLDFRFKKLIEYYTNVNKYDDHYERIYNTLKNVINEFEENNMSTENPKLILKESLKDLFTTKYKRSNLSNMYFYFYTTIFAYISEHYNHLLDQLANYYLKQICIGIDYNENVKEFVQKNRKLEKPIHQFLDIGKKFTFLSYAFHDKLVSFLLFLEAKTEDIVLFVDWMYSSDLSQEPDKLKKNLNYFLNASNKLLFLRSVNSELHTYVKTYGLFRQNKRMVRQWCSWEIGNYYTYSSANGSSTIKYQYNLHQEVSGVFDMQNKNLEENILLENLEDICRMRDLY